MSDLRPDILIVDRRPRETRAIDSRRKEASQFIYFQFSMFLPWQLIDITVHMEPI
jgi:hypothetical protein